MLSILGEWCGATSKAEIITCKAETDRDRQTPTYSTDTRAKMPSSLLS
jgi:hypothetical protein